MIAPRAPFPFNRNRGVWFVLVDELAYKHRAMPLRDLQIVPDVNALDLDLGHDLPEDARLPRRHKTRRAAVKADDGDFVGLGLHRLEHLACQIGPRGLEDREAVRGILAANRIMQLDRKPAQGIEQPVATGAEHALEPAVAQEEGALAVLHRQAQHQEVPEHVTSPYGSRAIRADRLRRSRTGPGRGIPSGRRAAALSSRDDGRERPRHRARAR